MVMTMNKKIKIILYTLLSLAGTYYLLEANQMYLTLNAYGKAQARFEMFTNPLIEVVDIKGSDAIVYVQQDNYVSCYYGRKKYGIVWQSFSGVGVFREIDDLSESAIKQYKQECINMYEVNQMENW
jgi:hypothetical protein